MKILMACDQSVRGFAIAAAPVGWAGDWGRVQTSFFDGGKVARGDDQGALDRLNRVYRFVDSHLVDLNPAVVGFESYGFSSKPDVHVVELVGAIKLRCIQLGVPVETIQQSSARKAVCGPAVKVPRKGEDAKKLMKQILATHGAPERITLDESDALVILNTMLVTHGGLALV